MRSLILLTITIFMCINAFAQQSRWNNAPATGFVFQITNDEAQKLLVRNRPDSIIRTMLHTEVDTFNLAKGWTRRPDKGHFILARIISNKLHCEYKSIFPYQVLLLKEYNALALQVLDRDGNIRDDARVRFRAKRIAFNPDTKTYRIENTWVSGIDKVVIVELEGFRSVFSIHKNVVPVWEGNSYYNNADDGGPDFYSYMITDKNKYKPGEKVRFKSYALSGSGSPMKRDLEIWLRADYKSIPLGKVSPHRPGSFAGEFQLHDSLKLDLDKSYGLELRERNGRMVSSTNFTYEEYITQGNKLTIELGLADQYFPASNKLTISATNENGLPLKDAKGTVTILTHNIRETFAPIVLLRDTLMTKRIDINGSGPTTVDIPATLFNKSNTSYEVHVVLLTSLNQRLEDKTFGTFYYSQYKLSATYQGDSILYQLLDKGVSINHVYARLLRNDDVADRKIILPYREKINQAATSVRISTPQVSRLITMVDLLPELGIKGGVRKDSIHVGIDNPHQLQFTWNIYQGNELVDHGSGTDIDFRAKIVDRTYSYYAEVLYAFGGSEHILTRTFQLRNRSLDITLNVPERIYPGQEVDVTIDVTDEEGNGVGGVDLTAFATTAKLNYIAPELPYHGSVSSSRSEQDSYTKTDLTRRTTIIDLDYNRWMKRARLDTMRYFQFAYPGNKMFITQTAISDSTQFSIFVIQKGDARKIHVIEVDGVPIYYAWTEQPSPYSFYISPDVTHQITLRLFDRVLMIDSICFDPCSKTIVSIDSDHLPASVTTHPVAPKLVKQGMRKIRRWEFTPTEVERYTPYVAVFQATRFHSYLSSPGQFVPIAYSQTGERQVIVGPIHPGRLTYSEHNHLTTTYRHEGGFCYRFEDNIVYKTRPKRLLPWGLDNGTFNPRSTLFDLALNKQRMLAPIPDAVTIWHPRMIDMKDYNSRVRITLPVEVAQSGVASVLFQNPATEEIASPCRDYNRSEYYTIPRGTFHVIVLYNNGSYLRVNSVLFQSNAHLFLDMRNETLHDKDHTSSAWLSSFNNNCHPLSTIAPRVMTLKRSRYSSGNVRGIIRDETNLPIPGVNVVVKGTVIGTVTDFNGEFELDVPGDRSTLVFSFIGYRTQEMDAAPGSRIAASMEADVTQLSEVVVTGYGVERYKSELAYSISDMLSGRIAGVSVSNTADDVEQPGAEIQQYDEEAERQLYEDLLNITSLRSQFSDVGFWEPRLFTDRNGKSTFTVKFPDDITRWDAVVYGMNRQLQTGTTRRSIKAYKPLMAELDVPAFLTVGDTANLIGRVTNYTKDKTIHGKTSWQASTSSEHPVSFESYVKEQFAVTATTSDSTQSSFSFTRDDGYFDGEERKIPVINQGTVRADGTLAMINNNDRVDVKTKKDEVVHIRLHNSQLDLYAQDAHYLINYKYDCNEQLASKLLGLLNYKLVMQYRSQTFQYDMDIRKIIERLLKNQNEEFLWSWWDLSANTSPWMSAHILRALKAAKEAGYEVKLDISNVARKATYQYDFMNTISLSDIHLLNALAAWNVSLDYPKYVKVLDRQIQRQDSIARHDADVYRRKPYSFLNDKLLLLEIRQLRGLPYHRDSILQYKKETALGEVYFTDGRPVYYWHTAETSTNAVAYRIIKRDTVLRELKGEMQMYFISSRRKNSWNTYESSNILTSVLPDLIGDGVTKKSPSSVTLAGKVNARVNKFPYDIALKDEEELSILKEGGLPLFVMQYTEQRVITAQTGSDAFTIKTKLSDSTLTAGKPVTLTATIEVKDDASLEHVMIEIPIPGSCQYADKRQFDNHIETHREYFKERTMIFCENMTPGIYTFQVQLLPRFTGRFNINPAQVSLMYFPVINANTDMKQVDVKE